MQHQHVDTDLHVQQPVADMLRVVFDCGCNEELRCRVGVMYEWTYVVSVGISECGSVVTAIYATVSDA